MPWYDLKTNACHITRTFYPQLPSSFQATHLGGLRPMLDKLLSSESIMTRKTGND